MAPRVYIDGQHGTIGLRIRDLSADRSDLEFIEIEPDRRKDPAARAQCLRSADLAILCLPDTAAREAVAMAEGSGVRIIDGSTAHRTDPGWVYGLPELAADQRARIASASRVANPGCYPTGVVLLLRPLIEAGLVDPAAPISVHALSGYSGGGRQLIERWEDEANGLSALPYEAPYAFDRSHKHMPEMLHYAGLGAEPQFVPAVGAFRCGMRIQIPLHASLLGAANGTALHGALSARYAQEACVRVLPLDESSEPPERAYDPTACNGSNRVDVRVMSHPAGHAVLMATLDNLGKGASGAAVQSMNLMLGLPELAGLSA